MNRVLLTAAVVLAAQTFASAQNAPLDKRLKEETLYRTSFCTLFQEWQATEEAVRVRKSFENVFLLPMPAVPVNVTVELYDFKNNITASLTHPVDPADILVRPAGGYGGNDIASLIKGDKRGRYIHYSGAPEFCLVCRQAITDIIRFYTGD